MSRASSSTSGWWPRTWSAAEPVTTDTAGSPLLASFRASYRELLRYLALRTGNADEARDLAHDTWLRVADMAREGREPALRSEGEARAYLFTMARNLVIDQRRRDGVAQRHAEQQNPDEAGVPDAAEAAMYGQAVAAVEAALASLPERARQVFLRHRVHGEDQGALARQYGISRNMVERDMMLAMDRVGAAMHHWHGSAALAQARGRRRSLAALLGLSGLAVGASVGWRVWRIAVPQWELAAATDHGQTLRRPLPDGSVLTLDALSRVQMAYYAGRRSVRLLAGAAFFEVVAEAGRPFVVDVPVDGGRGVRVTVLGTRFGVERLAGGGVDVQVESGRVRVQALEAGGPVAPAQELGAGEALRWSTPDASGTPVLRRLEGARAAASWRHGVLAFDAATLGETVERLRRYLPRPVEVAADAAALRLSGQVRIAQAEDFVRALPSIVPVRARLEDGRWRIAHS